MVVPPFMLHTFSTPCTVSVYGASLLGNQNNIIVVVCAKCLIMLNNITMEGLINDS